MSSENGSGTEAVAGFLQRIVSLLFQGGDAEKEKKRKLRELARTLRKQRYKFYKPKGSEALPQMAKFVHSFYKIVGPAQILMENAKESSVLKQIIIEEAIPEEIRTLRDQFTEEAIRARAEEVDVKTLTNELKDKLVSYYAAFDNEKVRKIDETFNLLSIFLDLVNFDYYFFLKKFDSRLPERDFNYNPRFEVINGEYVADDLKDFLSVMHLIPKNVSWDYLFQVLKEYKGVEVVNIANFKKGIKALEDLRRSRVLELIVQHIDQDPAYSVAVYPPDERVVEEYLQLMKTQAEVTIQKIVKEKQNRKIEGLLKQVFGTTAVSRTKNYTEKANVALSKKMVAGFIHVAPLNYLKAFMLDYFKRDIRELVDLLLIKGKWTTNIMSQQLSEAYYRLMEISQELVDFDDSLAEEGDRGMALNAVAKKSDRDPNNVTILRKVLKDLNDQALSMITESAHNFIAIGKSLKQIIEDYDKKPHEVIINWKEVESTYEGEIREKLVEIYRTIYNFIQLMQYYVTKKNQ